LGTTTARAGDTFEVLFYGSFLPLHGMEVILETAALLRDQPVNFTLIGGHKADLSQFRERMATLGLQNVKHVKWVDLEELPRWIAAADLGLGGPFGNTGQARRVITGKTFQFLAMGRAVVVGETDEDYGFRDKVNCLRVPQGDAVSLASAIQWARDHGQELERIGLEGRLLYQERFSVRMASKILEGSLRLALQ
jgi:glycosyltransferase involved in cell wall biosynthesis